MFFFVTSIFLECLFFSSFWVLKKTKNGLYYLITNNKEITNKDLLQKYEETKEMNIKLLKNVDELKNLINQNKQ